MELVSAGCGCFRIGARAIEPSQIGPFPADRVGAAKTALKQDRIHIEHLHRRDDTQRKIGVKAQRQSFESVSTVVAKCSLCHVAQLASARQTRRGQFSEIRRLDGVDDGRRRSSLSGRG